MSVFSDEIPINEKIIENETTTFKSNLKVQIKKTQNNHGVEKYAGKSRNDDDDIEYDLSKKTNEEDKKVKDANSLNQL